MRQLERLLGPDNLREGLRTYLKQFEFNNATWLDLVHLLDDRTSLDLAAWSRAWVEEAGRPTVRTELVVNQDRIQQLAFVEPDARWRQQIDVLLAIPSGPRSIPLELQSERSEVPAAVTLPRPKFVLPTGGGLAYGGFVLDDASRTFLLEHVPDIPDALTRGAAWVTLWDEMLDRRIRPSDLLELG